MFNTSIRAFSTRLPFAQTQRRPFGPVQRHPIAQTQNADPKRRHKTHLLCLPVLPQLWFRRRAMRVEHPSDAPRHVFFLCAHMNTHVPSSCWSPFTGAPCAASPFPAFGAAGGGGGGGNVSSPPPPPPPIPPPKLSMLSESRPSSLSSLSSSSKLFERGDSAGGGGGGGGGGPDISLFLSPSLSEEST